MINLLPPELKKSYRYSASNIILVRWVIAALISVVGLGVIGTYGWLSIHQNIVDYGSQINSTESTLKKDKQKRHTRRYRT